MPRPDCAAAFRESLTRREAAARRLEGALLTEVPLLYGGPDGDGIGPTMVDPGLVLARIHRENMVRRSSGGMTAPPTARDRNALPFERALGLLAFVATVLLAFGLLG